MDEKILNEWWSGLELKQLLRVFLCPTDMDYNDFIDELDDKWNAMTSEEKMKLYEYYGEALD